MDADRPRLPIRRSPGDVCGIDRAARVAWRAVRAAARAAEPGMTTRDLDGVVRRVISEHGGRPALEHLIVPGSGAPFPGAASICVNEQAAHAAPGGRVLRGGDLLTVDAAVELGGWFGDVAESVVVPGGGDAAALALLRAARAAVAAAVGACGPGVRWSTVARAVRACAARHDLTVLAGCSGHGIGRRLHEPPAAGYGARPGEAGDFVLGPGMVLTIEPVLLPLPGEVRLGEDGWALSAADGSWACYVERTVCITRAGSRVLGGASGGRGGGLRERDGL